MSKTNIIEEFKNKFLNHINDFSQYNNAKRKWENTKLGDNIESWLKDTIDRARKEERERVLKEFEESFTWTMPIKKTKKAGIFKVTGDSYIHIEWEEWLKFKELKK